MDFSFTKKEEEYRRTLRIWLEENLPEGWIEGKRDLPENEEEQAQFLRNWQKKMNDGGWVAIAWPEKYGGQSASVIEEIIYHQEMVRAGAPHLINYIGIHMVGPTLMDIGTEEQREKFIPKILNAEEVWCQGYSEPNAGSDLSALKTSAVKQGDKWIINGQKVWTSYGHLADRCFLLARTSNLEKKHKGITVFLVDMKQPGVEVRPIIQMNGKHDFNEVYFNDAVAYDEEIVGEIDEGWKVMINLMLHERTGIGAQIFTLEKQFSDLVLLTNELKENGQPLIKDPFTRQKMVELYTRCRGVLLTYYRNITTSMKRGYPGAESSMDKLMSSELTKDLFEFAVSIQGHEGVLWKEDALANPFWQLEYLSSFGVTIGGGTSEVQRNTIGERLLGLPKDLR